ncbi:MAG: hypothetical protein J0M02_16770 [Planctomycetes bacterium]|nr:hypothetical protein [Planctomycetota bacterium]
MPDPAAKTIYVVTLRGDRGPFSRADLAEALRAGEVGGQDQARSAFGRPLGTVDQVLRGPSSDRSPAERPPAPRVAPARRDGRRPWLAPLLVGAALLAVVVAMMALRGGHDLPPVPPTAPVAPPEREPAAQPIPQEKQSQQAQPAKPAPAPPAQLRDALPGIAEARGFRLVCDLDLLKLGRNFSYRVNNRDASKVPFDRVAYLVELSTAADGDRHVWVAMDAFTTDAVRTTVPTTYTKAFFQTTVRNLQVRSNHPGIPAGDHGEGNIEFWPCDYGEAASATVPGASSTLFDISDSPRLGKDGKVGEGHGSMQVHLTKQRLTLFAINNWRDGRKADLGIGNCPGRHPDWTFAANAGSYSHARLRVLIRPK